MRPDSLIGMSRIIFPLIVSLLSGSVMIFMDRMILAKYSTAAMNAATSSSSLFLVVESAIVALATIAEVFVGRYNGRGQLAKTGSATWQMIWFSLMSLLIFAPIGMYAGPYVLSSYHFHDFGLPYFEKIFLFGPFFPFVAALSAFFVGIGKTKLVLVSTVGANLMNFILDVGLIHGAGPFPEWGTSGAAIATGIAEGTQGLILFGIFMSDAYRRTYGTSLWRIKPRLFRKCIVLGLPLSGTLMIEQTAWALMILMMTRVSETHLLVIVFGQTLFTLLGFVLEGLERGVISMAANLIGGDQWSRLRRLQKTALQFLAMLSIPLGFVLFSYGELIARQFVDHATDSTLLISCCGWVWLYFVLDGITWISQGILTAAGDTTFVIGMNATSMITFALIPMYLLVVKMGLQPMTIWMIIATYAFFNSISFFMRCKQRVFSQNFS